MYPRGLVPPCTTYERRSVRLAFRLQQKKKREAIIGPYEVIVESSCGRASRVGDRYCIRGCGLERRQVNVESVVGVAAGGGGGGDRSDERAQQQQRKGNTAARSNAIHCRIQRVGDVSKQKKSKKIKEL